MRHAAFLTICTVLISFGKLGLAKNLRSDRNQYLRQQAVQRIKEKGNMPKRDNKRPTLQKAPKLRESVRPLVVALSHHDNEPGMKNKNQRSLLAMLQMENNHVIDTASDAAEIGTTDQHESSSTATTCTSSAIELISSLRGEIEEEVATLLFDDYRADLLPFLYKIYIDRSEDGEYFGPNGEYTKELLQCYHDMEVFWEQADQDGPDHNYLGGVDEEDSSSTLRIGDMSTNHTRLLAAHGDILSDLFNLAITLDTVFAFESTADIFDAVDGIQELIEMRVPRSYDNPLFTLNAVSFKVNAETTTSQPSNPDVPELEDTVVIGDGVLEALGANNGHLHGARFILGHEFGHQLQYEADIHRIKDDIHQVGSDTSEEATARAVAQANRDFELMADFFSAYFLGHSLGESLTTQSMEELTDAAAMFGDCSDSASTHHGMPLQRSCVVQWGAELAQQHRRQLTERRESSVPLLSLLVAEYEKALPELLAVDHGFCSLDFSDPVPTATPSLSPSRMPTKTPSHPPTKISPAKPLTVITAGLSRSAENTDTASPNAAQSASLLPTKTPPATPTKSPTPAPSVLPTKALSQMPTKSPTPKPSLRPTSTPSHMLSKSPTPVPSASHTFSAALSSLSPPSLPPITPSPLTIAIDSSTDTAPELTVSAASTSTSDAANGRPWENIGRALLCAAVTIGASTWVLAL